MEIYEIGEILLGIGFLICIIAFIGLIVALVRKRHRVHWVLGFFFSISLFIIGGVVSTTYETEEAKKRVETRKEIKIIEREISSLKNKRERIKEEYSEIDKVFHLIGEAKQIEFRVLDADAKFLKGTPVVYKGKIVQIQKRSNATDIRLRVGEETDSIIYLEYNDVVKGVYEDDIITICGVIKGYKTYKSIAGWKVTLPLINVEILSKGRLIEEKRKLTQRMEELKFQEMDIKNQIINYEKEIKDKEEMKEGEKTSIELLKHDDPAKVPIGFVEAVEKSNLEIAYQYWQDKELAKDAAQALMKKEKEWGKWGPIMTVHHIGEINPEKYLIMVPFHLQGNANFAKYLVKCFNGGWLIISQEFQEEKEEHEQTEETKEGNSWYPEQVLDEGIKEYTEAIELGIGGNEIYYNRGLLYLHKKEFDKAIADFIEAGGQVPYTEEALQQAKKMKKLVETGENQSRE